MCVLSLEAEAIQLKKDKRAEGAAPIDAVAFAAATADVAASEIVSGSTQIDKGTRK